MRWRLDFLFLVFLLALAVAASADQLVTVDGTVIETQGPWSVKGRQVLFTDRSGTLSALRLEEIDLDASTQASERAVSEAAGVPAKEEPIGIGQAAAQATAAREQSGEAVVVLTDADVLHVDPELVAAVPARPPRVIVYSTTWCPWCKKTKKLLASLGVPYTEKDIEKSPRAALEMARKAGAGAGVPIIDVGGTIVRGYDPERLVAALRARAERLQP